MYHRKFEKYVINVWIVMMKENLFRYCRYLVSEKVVCSTHTLTMKFQMKSISGIP